LIVGSSFKADGDANNPIDPKRVRQLIAVIAAAPTQ